MSVTCEKCGADISFESEGHANCERVVAMKAMLLECREEFCWHGNTGKHLSADTYASLVDKIDRVLGLE